MMLDGAILYDAERAPSPDRVRVFLAEQGVEVERVMVDLKRDFARSAKLPRPDAAA